VSHPNRVAGDGLQILQQSLKAVDWKTVVSLFASRLVLRVGGTLSRAHDRRSQRLARRRLEVIKQQRRQSVSEMPLDIKGQHAKQDMTANTISEPVMNRPDLQIDTLQGAKRPFHQQTPENKTQ